ncbi:MAG: MMPL family transporter [Planctomycetia bacterium]|nr:MMPL family transporter [Planctomycetia bacterium]
MFIFEILLNLIDRYRRPVWVVTVVAAAASIYYIARLQILDSPERWMPKSTQKAWQVFDSHFDVGDTIAVGLHFRRPVTEDDLPRLSRLRKQFAAVPGIKQVYDTSLVAEQIEGVPLLTLLDPAQGERFSLYAGALWDHPAPGETERTLVAVCELEFYPGKESDDELNERRRGAVNEVQRIVADERTSGAWGPAVEFHVASAIVMMMELEKRARQVAFTFLPVSIGVGMISLYLSFRTLRTLLVAVLGSGLAILLTLGWLSAGGGTLGVVTVATPALISIIAVASTMHFGEYAAEYGSTGEGRYRPQLISWVAVPCLGAAATTAVGFLMLVFNDLAPVRDLGLQLFVGSLLAFFGVFLMSQVIPIRNASGGAMLTHERFRRYTTAVTRAPVLTTLGLLVVTAVLLYCAWPRPADSPVGLYVNADPFSFFTKEQPIAKALDHFSKRQFGVYQLDVVLVPKEYAPPPRAGRPVDPVYEANRQSARSYSDLVTSRRDLGVLRVVSTDAFHQRQQAFQQQLEKVRREEGLRAYLAKLGRVTSQSAVFSTTFQSWNHDKQEQGALRLTFLAHDQGAQGFRPVLNFARDNLPHDRFDCYMCGSIAQVVQLGEGLTGGMLWGLGSSIVIIAVLCGLMFRSVKFMLLALPPNLFPVLVLYGLMGLFKIPLSAGSAMVATIALGIAVNDTMHFVLHYERLTRERGLGTRAAVVQTITDLGRPIVLTSVIHIAGFTVFLLTDFQPLFHFGLLSSAAMTAAMMGDLFMLPNLLMLFDRRPDTVVTAVPEAHVPHPQTLPVT